MTEPSVTVVGYTVTCVPESDVLGWHLFAINVEYAGKGQWAVRWMSQCLDVCGDWSYEPVPSSRDDVWLSRHRFDQDTALLMAKEAAPKVTVNGHTVQSALARHGVTTC